MEKYTDLISTPKRRPMLAFALAHFPFSLLSTFLIPCLSWYDSFFDGRDLSFVVMMVLLFVLYFPLGFLLGSCLTWARIDTPKALGRAVQSQTLVAWSWAALLLVSIFSPLGTFSILFTLLLAFPSSMLALTFEPFLLRVLNDTAFSFVLSLTLLAIPAGLLPPLLFNLGSFCATRHKTQSGPALERKNTKRTAE